MINRGRIFCFIAGDFCCIRPTRDTLGKNLLLPYWGLLDMLELLSKNLLLPLGG